jgi:hypothetical protein
VRVVVVGCVLLRVAVVAVLELVMRWLKRLEELLGQEPVVS